MPVSRKLRNLVNILKTQPKSLIILATETDIPKELADLITVLEFNLPTSQEIKSELLRLGQSLDKEFQPEFLELLIRSCQGLSIEKIRRALSKSIAQNGVIDKESINLILREKRQIIVCTTNTKSKPSSKILYAAKNKPRWGNAHNLFFNILSIFDSYNKLHCKSISNGI